MNILVEDRKIEVSKTDLSDHEMLQSLRLIRSENVGPKTYQNLLKLYGSVEGALSTIPELARKGGGKQINICSIFDAEQEIESCQKLGAQMISYLSPLYPKLLLHITDFPPMITVFGNSAFLSGESFAIVGARNASSNGTRFAYKLAQELGNAGQVIVSGLARGIDTATHKAALNTGTIAVIAGGIDKIYPPENAALYQSIKEEGLIVAELPFGTEHKGPNFPKRNRIISGMSAGTVVVEASLGSGSLITAGMALEQNRELFAVPGFPLDPRCYGTNNLLKDGANLVTCSNDILEAIRNLKERHINYLSDDTTNPVVPMSYLDDDLATARNVILNLLSSSPTKIDDIIQMTNLPIPVALTIILELELAGKIERHLGNSISYIFNTK